jgi:SAM-dependent methyltransferase
MTDGGWYRRAFDREYFERWVRSGATSWDPVRDTQHQVDFVVRAMRPEPGAAVLDVACGHGRHAIELARRGYEVTGVDLSVDLLDIARAEAAAAGVEVRWVEGDMRDALPGSFDAAVCLDTSVGYFDSDEEDAAALANMQAALRPGGRLILDVLNRDAFLDAVNTRYWRELAGGELLLLDRRMDLATSRLCVDSTIVDADGTRHARTFRMRLYTLAELSGKLGGAGFDVLRAWGNFAGAPAAAHRSRLVLLAERA